MSPEASSYLRTLAAAYEAAAHPSHSTWYFDAGKSSSVHTELAGLGLISKGLGTKKGYAWRLTDAGLVAVSQLVPAHDEVPDGDMPGCRSRT